MDETGKTAIAVIEDNLDLNKYLVLSLSFRGFAPTAFKDAETFFAALNSGGEWKVIVLDLGLPGEDGLSVARRMRTTHPELGIIMLTGRGSLKDRIRGRNEGADIYLVKPTDMDELAAAIQAIVRRLPTRADTPRTWQLDPEHSTLSSPGGEINLLTYTELAIVKALQQSPDHFCSRIALMVAMAKNPEAYDERALEMAISRLRKKLGPECPLKSVRFRGYAFSDNLTVLPVAWDSSGLPGAVAME